MNKILLVLLSATLIFSSCSKDGDTTQPEEIVTNQTVAINGTTYPAVKIGTQTWTAVNYNGSGGQNYNSTTNDPAYGKLYTVAESKAITLPAGWRLPTKADFEKLISNYPHTVTADGYNILPDGCKKLKSTTGWTVTTGDNTSGFNALSAGIGVIPTTTLGQYQDKGSDAWFISSTNGSSRVISGVTYTDTYAMNIASETYQSGNQNLIDDNGSVHALYQSADYRYSIRFVKDN